MHREVIANDILVPAESPAWSKLIMFGSVQRGLSGNKITDNNQDSLSRQSPWRAQETLTRAINRQIRLTLFNAGDSERTMIHLFNQTEFCHPEQAERRACPTKTKLVQLSAGGPARREWMLSIFCRREGSIHISKRGWTKWIEYTYNQNISEWILRFLPAVGY